MGLILIGADKVLTREEFHAKCEMIKAASFNDLDRAWGAIEAPSAVCVISALATRLGNIPGIGEASEIWSLAARYMDSGQLMPPKTAKWEKAWYLSFVPEGAQDWADDIQDVYNRLLLKTSPEYDVVNPPSILGGPQSAGYRHTLYDILRSNIEAYTDINAPSSEQAPASTPAIAPSGGGSSTGAVPSLD